MSYQILQSKFFIPAPKRTDIQRTALLTKLHSANEKRLILVSAGAGYGKTTLITQFAHETAHTVAWLSLDVSDNHPKRFWQYCFHALVFAGVELDEASLSDFVNGNLALDDWLVRLVNQIISAKQPVSLVLDDYHVLMDDSIHAGIAFLLENTSPNFHIIIISRTDPSLPLSRFRAKNQLLDIRASQLSFSLTETHDLIAPQVSVPLSDDAIAQLVTTSEGWIAGIHLALLNAKQRDNPNDALQTISGTHRHIFEYLVDDVLQKQSHQIRQFLLSTAILNRFSSDVCDALLLCDDSQSIINNLVQSNLFIVQLDNQREWFRYHHLFHDVLREHLQQAMTTDHISPLHQRAAQWFHQHAHYKNALHHATQAHDFDLIKRIIVDGSVEMFAQGYVNDLRQWIETLSADLIASDWQLCIVYAWTHRYVRDVQGMQHYIDRAEKLFQAEMRSENDRRWYLAEKAGLQAFIAYVCGENDRVLEHHRILEKYKTAQNDSSYALTLLAVAGVYKRQGQVSQAIDTYQQVIKHTRTSSSMLRFIAYVDLSVLYITQAHVRQAEALVDTFINHCHAHAIEPPILGGILLNSAMIAYEYNQLADANAHITKAIQLIKRGGVENALVFAYAYRFFVASAQEKWSVAHDALTHYENIIRKWDAATLYDNNLLAYRIDLETRRGNHARALSMLQEATITPADTIHTQKASLYLALLRALIASRHLDDAQIVCEKLLSMSKQQGTQRDIPYLNMRYAIIKYLQNEHDTARDYLKLALSDAQLYGLVQSIISPPHETQALLRLAQKHNIAPDYVSSLLTHITPQQAPKTLASPLTKRELQILRLLHDGKTNQEIASELVIALSTTKRHIMNIYAKLDVHNRTHAVLRGNQLGLIE